MAKNQPSINLETKSDGYFSQVRQEMIPYIPTAVKTVLDAGCGSGYFGGYIKNTMGAEVWGIERDAIAAGTASPQMDRILLGDIHTKITEVPDGYFDVIFFNDILEHLEDPYTVLRSAKSKLTARGLVVCSIPNVRYITNLKKLLIDKQWKYEEYGILDKTHLRFFTKNSLIDMFSDLGYVIDRIEGINPIRSVYFPLLNALLLGHISDSRYLQFACVVRPVRTSAN